MKAIKPLVSAISAAIALSASVSAQAVTDEEFQALQDQLNQLADAFENQAVTEPRKVHIGGYGELHYNNWEFPDGSKFKELDFHRFVLFFGYDFSDSIRFHSEIEIEHAFVEDTDDGSNPGAVELEQAYVEFDLTENMETKGGLFLMPVGIINETHEPTTFYGVERNPVETRIIPTTWWEGGAALTGRLGGSGVSYDLTITSGLDGGTNIRGGRQKVAKATANDLAYTGRLKYTGLRGLELAATAQYQANMAQSLDPDIGAGVLFTTHAIWNISQFQVRALYAGWDIDVSSSASADEQARDKQDGYYLEGSWKFIPSTGVFVRYDIWDNGGLGDTEKTQANVGINYWPHEGVVIKFDIQRQDHGAANAADEADGFNIGIGYAF
ncbi:MAG: porin [Gammaproteobacteria bacterium]|nr:porin [Gammaproteobacteria bacterium]